MKLCYIDESGNNQHDTVHIMCGVLIDHTKIRKHSAILELKKSDFLKKYADKTGKNVNEIKTYQVYKGRNSWSKVDGEERKDFILKACQYAQEIPCNLIISAINFDLYKSSKNNQKKLLNHTWKWAASHIILQIQSLFFKVKMNKGNTLVIFDDHYGDIKLINSVLSNHGKLDYFYKNDVSRKKKKLKKDEVLNQIIDILAIESASSIFIQLADIYAYIIKRKIELESGEDELYLGDEEFVSKCFNALQMKIVWKDKYWNNNNVVSSFYGSIAPKQLKKIIKGK